MELVTGTAKSRLDEINRIAVEQCEWVQAAIAYVTDEKTLLKQCLKHGKRLALWARYDYSVPVGYEILRMFLDRNRAKFVLRLVPDRFHPKVIWWHGYGAYVGSANLSTSAWFRNFEAGVFFSQEDLEIQGLSDPLRQFFFEIDAASHPLTREIVEEMGRWTNDRNQTAQSEAEKRFERERTLPPLQSLISVDQKKARQKHREDFLREWNDTLQILRGLALKVAQHRPAWLRPDVPAGAQADRFLHAYYVEHIGEGNAYPYLEHYRINRTDPDAATERELTWWQNTPSSPVGAGEFLHDYFPLLNRYLSKDRLLQLSEDEFAEMCVHVHAFHDYSLRASWQSLGLSAKPAQMKGSDRAKLVARRLYRRRSKAGRSTLEAIFYVLHEDPIGNVPNRIFEACFNPEFKIPNLGLGTLGEMAGWAHPDEFPPRNGRTSKSLRGLGYPVRVYCEESSSPA
jgi:hypothetical protein